MTIEELRQRPCGKGHSREDAYVYRFNPVNRRQFVVCRKCALERYHQGNR